MKYLLLSMFLLSTTGFAGTILGLGGGLALNHESEQARNGDPLLEMESGFGLGFSGELFPGPLTLNLGLQSFQGKATSQYLSGATTEADVSTDAQNVYAFVGPRWRFLMTKYFTSFVGAGPVVGQLALDYSGLPSGAKEKEARTFTGYFLEGGMEFILSANHAFRISAGRTQYETLKFETLNDRALKMGFTQIGLLFMINLK